MAAGSKKNDIIIIKKYANRRLYNTDTSIYVTLDDLYEMVKQGVDFEVRDAKSNEDLTRSVLTQIIFEREGKGETNLLPINFLKTIISFYENNNMQPFVPPYLEASMQMFMRNQEKFADMFRSAGFGAPTPGLGGLPPAFGNFDPLQNMEELTKKNMEMFQQAMSMFGPLGGLDKKDK